MKNFKTELFELLTIQAPSGKEAKVRKYLQPRLALLVDNMFVDAAGNLLAEKKVGTGEGVTVMLSAHMDSVRNIQKGRQVKEKNGVFYSTKGVLGADDRAGIAIIMAVLRNVDKLSFDGTIKVAFTVSEEIGCVGSGKMDAKWYQDAALAIVVDRRGNRDIVTGVGSPYNFCSEQVGKFFEECSAMLDMDWKAVGGGISDATSFSDNGVHSVNLSAGYMNEHTPSEYVVINDAKDTINLILQALTLVNQFADTFGEIPVNNYTYGGVWDDYGYDGYKKSSKSAQDSASRFTDELIFETNYQKGNVSVTDLGGYYAIQQEGTIDYDAQEVWMFSSDYRDMVDAYLELHGLPNIAALKATQEAITAATGDEDGKILTSTREGELVALKV